MDRFRNIASQSSPARSRRTNSSIGNDDGAPRIDTTGRVPHEGSAATVTGRNAAEGNRYRCIELWPRVFREIPVRESGGGAPRTVCTHTTLKPANCCWFDFLGSDLF